MRVLRRDGFVIVEDAGIEQANRGALGELYACHAQGAGRLAYLLTGDRQLAEDLVQDAFVRLAQRFVHLRDPGAFDAYLRKTIVNLANSYFRRRQVERRHLQRESARPTHVDEADGFEWEAMKRMLLQPDMHRGQAGHRDLGDGDEPRLRGPQLLDHRVGHR